MATAGSIGRRVISLRRRTVLRVALAGAATAASAALSACGGETAPTATSAVPATGAPPSARPTTAPASAPTPAPATGASPTSAPATGVAATTAPASTTGGAAATPRLATAGATGAGATAAPAAVVDGRIPGGAPGIPDAYTKPIPPFRSVAAIPGKGGKVTTFQIAEGQPVTPRSQNRYWQELERRLGVQQLDVTFGPTANWAEKFSTVIAGGDLPDLCWLYPTDPRAGDQFRGILQGAFTDLTPYLNPDARKEYPNLARLPEDAWRNIQINKKLYGVPRATFLVPTLLYRRDWAEKVGTPQPKNADEFFELMTRYTKGDPDGNGKADTFGMGGFNANPMSLGFIRSMFRVPDGWRQNPDGTLTAAVETAEYKDALAYARRLWDAGLYHPDTPTMTAAQVREGAVAGKFGAYYESITGLSGRRNAARQVNPAADLRAMVPPGYDGGRGVVYRGAGHVGFTAISAKAGRDKERVKELLRILDFYASPFGSEERIFLASGLEGVHHEVKEGGVRLRNDRGLAEIGDLPNLSFAPPVFYYADELDLAPYMQGLLKDLFAVGIDNPTVGYYSPTAAAKAAELNNFVTDKEIGFVTGREPLGSVDAFARDWRSRGGDMIRKEYEDALKGQ